MFRFYSLFDHFYVIINDFYAIVFHYHSIKVASSPRLSGIGMPSHILWSHLLKIQRIVLLRSHLWWELGTNSLITGPGEWLSFRRFTRTLSWSWITSISIPNFSFIFYITIFVLYNRDSYSTFSQLYLIFVHFYIIFLIYILFFHISIL